MQLEECSHPSPCRGVVRHNLGRPAGPRPGPNWAPEADFFMNNHEFSEVPSHLELHHAGQG